MEIFAERNKQNMTVGTQKTGFSRCPSASSADQNGILKWHLPLRLVAFAIAACGMASKAATFYASKRPRTQSFIAKKEGIILLFRIFGM
jgi:hypothetical protein